MIRPKFFYPSPTAAARAAPSGFFKNVPSVILYEYPFNERMRNLLRVEYLYERLLELMARETALDHHFAIVTLEELLGIVTRKTELDANQLLNDLERHKAQLESWRGNPAAEQSTLDRAIAEIDACHQALRRQPESLAQMLNEDDLLVRIRTRLSVPGGTGNFDLPVYHHWQNLVGTEQRRGNLHTWAQCLRPLFDTVKLMLRMTRDSGEPVLVQAAHGQFQQTLPLSKTYQLLRVRLDRALGVLPEISGNRFMVSVRLMRLGSQRGSLLVPAAEHAQFELTLCAM